MSFGPSQAETQASAYQQQYQGNLQQSQQYGQGIIDQGLANYQGLHNESNGILGGANFQKQYAAQLGGLETSNSTMKSIADRLASFDVGSLNQGSVENLAVQNQAQDGAMQADLASRGLSGNGGTGLAALLQYRQGNQKGYADQLRANQQAGTQSLGMAGQLYGQVGQNQQGLLSLLGNLDLQKAGLDQQGLGQLLQLGGSIYGNSMTGQGNLNAGMQQSSQANAQGRGNMIGGVAQGLMSLAGTAITAGFI